MTNEVLGVTIVALVGMGTFIITISIGILIEKRWMKKNGLKKVKVRNHYIYLNIEEVKR
jgi:hypothetical protein